MEIEQRDGWWWPKTDKRCWSYMQRFPDLPQRVAQYVKNLDTAIQAGGNAGFYTKQYAKLFSSVYTFEPDFINFHCLTRNVTEHNVVKIQSCIGNERGLTNLHIDEGNRGKNYIEGSGIYPILKIDDLNVNQCSLIHLDIEGYEYNALLGAIDTIERCRPTVVVEIWDVLTNRFGEDLNEKTKQLMSDLNYQFVDLLDGSDWVFRPIEDI